jgi:hypothetical protein
MQYLVGYAAAMLLICVVIVMAGATLMLMLARAIILSKQYHLTAMTTKAVVDRHTNHSGAVNWYKQSYQQTLHYFFHDTKISIFDNISYFY